MKKALSLLLVFVMLISTMPMTVLATEVEHTHTYENGICTGCGAEKTVIPYDQLSTVWPSVNTDLTHIICYGQSFSVGADAPYYADPAVDGVYVFGNITNSTNGTALSGLTGTTKNQHPIVSTGNVFAKLLAGAGIDTDIILGSYGSGGRTIAQLMSAERQAEIKEEDGYTYDILSSGRYEIFQSSVSALAQYAQQNQQSISCPAIVYLQGETDQNTDAQLGYPENPARAGYGAGGDKEKYKEYMSRLKEDMQREVMEQYGQTEKPLFVIYQVSGTYTRTDYSSINMAQLEFAQENKDVVLVQSPYFTSHYTNSHHLTQNGYRWLGEYIGRSLYTALVEREKPWPMLPTNFTVENGNTVRISISGVQNGLTIDTYTVENATDSRNLYGFCLEVDGARIKPASVTVSGDEIIVTLPQSVNLYASEKVYLIYAGRRASGTGNIRDNCTEVGFYDYLDDSNDTGTGNNQGVSHSSLDVNGNSIIGQKYPLYNWLAAFCYEVEVPEVEIPEATPRQAAEYHWEMQETGLVSITDGNAVENNLTLLQGSVESGVLKKAHYSIEKTIVLQHDLPWVLEWKAAGNGNSYPGGKLLSASKDSDSVVRYLYLPADSRSMIAWGVSSESGNFGFKLSAQGIDIRKEHIYRIENRIAEDGVNTVYLIVDGVEIGAMVTGYRTSSSPSGSAGSMMEEPNNWANGRDIYLGYLGEPSNFLLNNMKLSYLKVWENGISTGCGENEPSESMSLRYDDHLDMSGKTVEIIDAGTPTSYQVGYGVEENAVSDTAVVTLEGNYLVATGIGTAKVKIDGVLYEVSVEAAPISLLLLIGQSNMRGSEGNANQSIVCPDGMVYATYGDDRGADNTAMTVNNATMFVPSALTGEYSGINVEGTTDCLSGYPVYSLTEAGAGKIGPDSGFAYEWVKQTGEKVWIVNAAHGGTSINVWQPGTTEYEQCQALFTACQETLRKEIAAGHFTLSHMGYFWCQGCSDRTQSAAWYVEKYLAMHEGFKTELAFDHDSNPETADKTFEFGGIIPVRVGSTATCYRDGAYTVSNPYAYHESFVDLRFNGPRVAQYWMINNPELTDIWGVCNIGEDWVWMPDGTNGVTEYFQTHYPNGRVDYTTQVTQKESWYTPTTPKAVHDSIHYNQIGYNEIGRESVRNALILLGELEALDVETTVELLTWDGYTEATQVPASTTGNSATIVVPVVYPIWKSKDVTYELSEGLSWNYYDLLADTMETEGVLTTIGVQSSVNVTKPDPGSHFAGHLSQLPEKVCCGLNLWSVLEHDEYYYASGTHWGIYSSGEVPSVTISVNPGDRIFATSFGKAGENGHTSSNGIRVTFFSAYGVAKTMTPAECYAEFSANGGYLVAPENAVAINIAMWNNSDDNEIYILSLPHDITDELCSICGKGSHTHDWTDWETVTEPGPNGPGVQKRSCACGETETREIISVWQTTNLAQYIQQLPDNTCCGLNLWAVLNHDSTYYVYSTGDWGNHSSRDVPSITIPVNPGDMIFATSFGPASENGHGSANGIRVTWFGIDGVLKTTDPAGTYAEVTANGGYLIAPEDAIAINIPLWGDSTDHEVFILNRDHCYRDEFDAFCDGCNAIREINYPAESVELREIDGVKYIYVNGKTSVEGLFKVGDDYYYATWGGVVLYGDQYVHFSYCDKAAGRHFYFSEDGQMLDKGFVTGEDGIKRLYVDSRTSVEGLFEVDGKYYLATWGGVVLTDGRYYISESFVDGIDGGRNFTVGSDGKILDGVVEIDGQKYYYDFGTTVFPGIYEIDGIEYTVTWGGLIEE